MSICRPALPRTGGFQFISCLQDNISGSPSGACAICSDALETVPQPPPPTHPPAEYFHFCSQAAPFELFGQPDVSLPWIFSTQVAVPPVPPPTVSSPRASLPTALAAYYYPASPALHGPCRAPGTHLSDPRPPRPVMPTWSARPAPPICYIVFSSCIITSRCSAREPLVDRDSNLTRYPGKASTLSVVAAHR
jgi:hypothetical protein